MSDFQIKITEPPQDKDLEKRLQEEVFSLAIDVQNHWIDNLSTGEGMSSHGHPYVNTGEAVSSIHLDPEDPNSDTYTIYSDKIQTLTAEIGLAPGNWVSFKALSQWVHEKLKIPLDDPANYPITKAIQKNIFDNGLDPFSPMEKAIVDVIADLEERLGKALDPK